MGYRKTLWREWRVGKCRPSHDYVYVEFCGLLSKYHLPTAAIWHLFPDDQVLLALYWMKRWNEASWSCFRSQGAFSFPPFRANVNSCLHKWHVLCWGSFLLFFFVSAFLSWSLQGSTSASFEMTAQIFTHHSLLGCDVSTDLHMANHPSIPGVQQTWLWQIIFPVCFCIWLVHIFVESLYA